VGHDYDLSVASQHCKAFADLTGSSAANTGINFVKYKGWRKLALG
jgi:hypothetical protein